MIYVVSWENRDQFKTLLDSSFRLRYRVFKERLGWDVQTNNDMEYDEFDQLPGTLYILHVDHKGEVDGCARLLPTTGPNMLRDVFPVLLDGKQPPCSPRIWESTRFAVNHGANNSDAGIITSKLLDAMCEIGVVYGLQTIVSVTDLLVERILKRNGLKTERLGGVHQIGIVKAVAGSFNPSQEEQAKLRESSGLKHSQIHAAAWLQEVA